MTSSTFKMDEKVLTSSIFKDRKESYEDSITVTFKTDRLTTSSFFAALPKPKQELLTTNKKFLIDPNEKIMVKHGLIRLRLELILLYQVFNDCG